MSDFLPELPLDPPADAKCPACDGTGTVHDEAALCLLCQGTGGVDASEAQNWARANE